MQFAHSVLFVLVLITFLLCGFFSFIVFQGIQSSSAPPKKWLQKNEPTQKNNAKRSFLLLFLFFTSLCAVFCLLYFPNIAQFEHLRKKLLTYPVSKVDFVFEASPDEESRTAIIEQLDFMLSNTEDEIAYRLKTRSGATSLQKDKVPAYYRWEKNRLTIITGRPYSPDKADFLKKIFEKGFFGKSALNENSVLSFSGSLEEKISVRLDQAYLYSSEQHIQLYNQAANHYPNPRAYLLEMFLGGEKTLKSTPSGLEKQYPFSCLLVVPLDPQEAEKIIKKYHLDTQAKLSNTRFSSIFSSPYEVLDARKLKINANFEEDSGLARKNFPLEGIRASNESLLAQYNRIIDDGRIKLRPKSPWEKRTMPMALEVVLMLSKHKMKQVNTSSEQPKEYLCSEKKFLDLEMEEPALQITIARNFLQGPLLNAKFMEFDFENEVSFSPWYALETYIPSDEHSDLGISRLF